MNLGFYSYGPLTQLWLARLREVPGLKGLVTA